MTFLSTSNYICKLSFLFSSSCHHLLFSILYSIHHIPFNIFNHILSHSSHSSHSVRHQLLPRRTCGGNGFGRLHVSSFWPPCGLWAQLVRRHRHRFRRYGNRVLPFGTIALCKLWGQRLLRVGCPEGNKSGKSATRRACVVHGRHRRRLCGRHGRVGCTRQSLGVSTHTQTLRRSVNWYY